MSAGREIASNRNQLDQLCSKELSVCHIIQTRTLCLMTRKPFELSLPTMKGSGNSPLDFAHRDCCESHLVTHGLWLTITRPHDMLEAIKLARLAKIGCSSRTTSKGFGYISNVHVGLAKLCSFKSKNNKNTHPKGPNFARFRLVL